MQPFIDRKIASTYIFGMMRHKILTIAEHREQLKIASLPVGSFDQKLRQLVREMFEVMYAAPGIGLAAVQIGIHMRIVTIDVADKKNSDAPDQRVLINPEIIWSSLEKNIYEEGCLSIPEYYENVERPACVKVKYQDEFGEYATVEVDGILATCIQHEVDHTNGVLFIDHISKLKRSMILKKFKKAAKKGEPVKPLAEDKEPSHHIG